MAETQLDLFRADTLWFHIFRGSIFKKDCAEMGPYGYAVYSVIKAHVDFETGLCNPSVQRISDLSGISERQVARELVRLEQLGFLRREGRRRSNLYRVMECFPVLDAGKEHVATVKAPYIPLQVEALRARIKSMLTDGSVIAGDRHITINIQINAGNGIIMTRE